MPFVAILDGVKVEIIGHDLSTNVDTANVMHVIGTAGISVADLTAIAEAFVNRWELMMSAEVVGNATWSLTEVIATDVNTVGGAQWVQTVSGGGGTGSSAPAGVCSLVKLLTAQRGRRARGRVFLGPLVLGAFTGDQLTSAYVTALNTQLTDLVTDLAALSTPTTLAVASRVDGIARPVTTFSIETTVAYQRRRGAR